jgi:hypothetical protein
VAGVQFVRVARHVSGVLSGMIAGRAIPPKLEAVLNIVAEKTLNTRKSYRLERLFLLVATGMLLLFGRLSPIKIISETKGYDVDKIA